MAKTVVLQQHDLLRAISLAGPYASPNVTTKVLGDLLFKGGPDFMTVTATDMDVTVTAPVAVKNCGGLFSFCLPAARVKGWAGLLPNVELSVTTTERDWTEIKYARGRAKMAGHDPDDFPTIQGEWPEMNVVLPLQELAAAINLVGISVSPEEGRFSVPASLVELSTDGLGVVGTDGHRLSRVMTKVPGLPAIARVVLPIRAMHAIRDIAKLLSGAKELRYGFRQAGESGAGLHFFSVDSYTVVCRDTIQPFPDYKRAMPVEYKGTAFMSRTDFLEAMRRTVSMADNKSSSVTMTLSTDQLAPMLGLSTVGGEVTETADQFPVRYDGDNFEIKVNGRYVMDFLTKATAPELSFHFNESRSAMEFREVGTSDSTYLVMPMRG